MAVGSKDGRLSVIQISDNLSSVTKNDKAALTSVSSRRDFEFDPVSAQLNPINCHSYWNEKLDEKKLWSSGLKTARVNKDPKRRLDFIWQLHQLHRQLAHWGFSNLNLPPLHLKKCLRA